MARIVARGEPPSPGYQKTGRWHAVAEALMSHPRETVLLPEFTQMTSPVSAVTLVNSKPRLPTPLRPLGGTVRASITNQTRVDGVLRADVSFTWTPAEEDS